MTDAIMFVVGIWLGTIFSSIVFVVALATDYIRNNNINAINVHNNKHNNIGVEL